MVQETHDMVFDLTSQLFQSPVRFSDGAEAGPTAPHSHSIKSQEQ